MASKLAEMLTETTQETNKQKKFRRQTQREERDLMTQEDTYLFPHKEQPIETFIRSYPQFKQQVGESLIREVVRGNINEKEFEELKNKLDLLEKNPQYIKKYRTTLKSNRFKRKTQKIFLR